MTPPSTITLTLIIGNTDNKLTQSEWSNYCSQFMELVTAYSDKVHFCGGPSTWSTYQNLCMVSEISTEQPEFNAFGKSLQILRERFRQDSIAYCPGITQFI